MKLRLLRKPGLLIIVTTLFLFGCINAEKKYESGIYYGESEGYYSHLTVEVEVNEYEILEIRILEDEEPEILSNIVFEKLPKKIIKANSADIDGISGATYTSRALLEAVSEALESARKGIE